MYIIKYGISSGGDILNKNEGYSVGAWIKGMKVDGVYNDYTGVMDLA